jgi:hypothetical protein
MLTTTKNRKGEREIIMGLVADIINGNHDSELSEITDAVNHRKKLKRSQTTAIAMATIVVGDIVILKGLTPKYVNGLKAKVVGKKQTKLNVTLVDGPVGRFGGSCTVPASCVDKV